MLPLRIRMDLGAMVLNILQSSMTGAAPSDGFVSYPGHSAEMQPVYSTVPDDWAVLVSADRASAEWFTYKG